MKKSEAGLRPRRSLKDSKRFKSNQVVMGTTRLAKKDHEEAEKPQLLLLSRLYVPGKPVTKLDTASKRLLDEHLPVLVAPGYSELNLEVHLLLSTVVTNYVCSWYTKLGTDNFEFVEEVYKLLCTLVQDVCSRWSRAIEQERLLALVDDFAAILEEHIEETEVRNGQLSFIEKERESLNSTNRVTQVTTDQSVVEEYLASRHAIFDPRSKIEGSDDNPRVLYFRVLVHQMLECVFLHRRDNPLSSDIIEKFVVSLLGDFILEKAFIKLSSPSFIRGTVFAKLAEITAVCPKPETKESLATKVKNAYFSIRSFMQLALSKKEEISSTEEKDGAWSPFHSPVFTLLNTLTRFQSRLPVVYHMGQIARCTLSSMGVVTAKINTFVSSFLVSWTSQASFVSDESMAANLKNLRTILFGDEPDNKEDTTISTNELAARFSSSITNLLANLGVSPSLLARDNEFPDLTSHIANVLQSFESQTFFDETPDSSKLNQLLIIQILDLLVARLFPELTQPQS